MEPCIPLPLEDDVLEELIEKSKDWAVMHGVGIRTKEGYSKDSLFFAPFLLLPSTFPRSEFEKATNIQPVFNELIHKVAHDYDFLRECLLNTVQVDDFTRKLFEIYETVRAEGVTQELSLGLLRSDYFLQPSGCGDSLWETKQVEVNTVASSFGALSTSLFSMHRFVLTELGQFDNLSRLPENRALQGLCGGMLKAWELYDSPQSAILFLVEDVSYNICDQRFHEFELKKQNPRIKVVRKTLTQIAKEGQLDKEKRLILKGSLEVGVVYFRAGYTPDHYPDGSEAEWGARLMIERSRAIKCPSIHYHLAGTKKVQQELARPGVIEKFLHPDKVVGVKEVFTGLYSLDRTESGDAAIEMALKDPSNFVLKPQREGGGNNVYGEEVGSALQRMKDSKERSAWILMERINPPKQKNYMVRPNAKDGKPIYTDFVSELGIFGVVIGDSQRILVNEQVGHMLRTKIGDADEGGVAAGFGALDSVFLVDL